MPSYNPQVIEQLYNSICFRHDGCLEGLQVREFARRLWAMWENQQQTELQQNCGKTESKEN